MRVGDWNVAIGAVGSPGCGKSVYSQARVRQIIARQPCYVVAHDPTMSIRGPDVTRHRSAESLLRALQGPRARGIHCFDVAKGLDVVALAIHVAEAGKRHRDPVPTICMLDEIVAGGAVSPSYLAPVMSEAYALRRHHHLGFVFCSQRPAQAHPTIWELSTEIVIFRQENARTLRYLEDVGVRPEILERCQTLPYFWHPQAAARPDRIPPDAPTSRNLADCFIISKT